MSRTRVVAAVAWREDRLLLTQRPPGGPHGLMWEFPGGKLEPGEDAAAALAREIEEELGVAATPGAVLAVETHRYPHGLEVEIAFVECALASTDFRPSAAVNAVRWATPAEVNLDSVLAADRAFLVRLGARPLTTDRAEDSGGG